MRDYQAIRDLYAQGMSIHDIARRTGYSRNTIRRAIRIVTPPHTDAADLQIWPTWPLRETIQLSHGTLTIEMGAGMTQLELLRRFIEIGSTLAAGTTEDTEIDHEN